MREEPGQAVDRALAQALALREEPLLVGRLLHAQAGEEVAAVARQGVSQPFRRRLAHGPLERRGVYVDARGVQRDGVAIEADQVGQAWRLPQREENLTQVRPRGGRGQIGPEQSRKLVPRMRRAGRQRQECEERLRLAPGNLDRLASVELGAEAAQQLQDETYHSRGRTGAVRATTAPPASRPDRLLTAGHDSTGARRRAVCCLGVAPSALVPGASVSERAREELADQGALQHAQRWIRRLSLPAGTLMPRSGGGPPVPADVRSLVRRPALPCAPRPSASTRAQRR